MGKIILIKKIKTIFIILQVFNIFYFNYSNIYNQYNNRAIILFIRRRNTVQYQHLMPRDFWLKLHMKKELIQFVLSVKITLETQFIIFNA